jgi:hypothetical protein
MAAVQSSRAEGRWASGRIAWSSRRGPTGARETPAPANCIVQEERGTNAVGVPLGRFAGAAAVAR